MKKIFIITLIILANIATNKEVFAQPFTIDTSVTMVNGYTDTDGMIVQFRPNFKYGEYFVTDTEVTTIYGYDIPSGVAIQYSVHFKYNINMTISNTNVTYAFKVSNSVDALENGYSEIYVVDKNGDPFHTVDIAYTLSEFQSLSYASMRTKAEEIIEQKIGGTLTHGGTPDSEVNYEFTFHVDADAVNDGLSGVAVESNLTGKYYGYEKKTYSEVDYRALTFIGMVGDVLRMLNVNFNNKVNL